MKHVNFIQSLFWIRFYDSILNEWRLIQPKHERQICEYFRFFIIDDLNNNLIVLHHHSQDYKNVTLN